MHPKEDGADLFPKQELLGSSPQKKTERAWRDGWHAARELGARGVCFGAGGPRSLDGWHAVLELAVWHAAQEMGGPRSLDGWHAAQELGARGRGFGAGDVAHELGARGVWMGGTRLMHWDLAPKTGDSRQPTPSISILSKRKHTQTHIHTYIRVPNRIDLVKCGER